MNIKCFLVEFQIKTKHKKIIVNDCILCPSRLNLPSTSVNDLSA